MAAEHLWFIEQTGWAVSVEDKIFSSFLQRQYEEGMALSRSSDLLELNALGAPPPARYIAQFRCKGLVRTGEGDIIEANCFVVGIWFPPDYLRHAEPAQILTWFAPLNVFHPNINAPFICVGRISPGTTLVDILFQIFEILTYNKVTPREDDALNKDACAWARRNIARFPVDKRPLKRRALALNVD